MATSVTLADLFPYDDGTVLVARDAMAGVPRHISQVANGLLRLRTRPYRS
ncbi:hypothetical protein [Rhizobium gallicum]|nr:hypothetical protein [Rhizobium gallicum]